MENITPYPGIYTPYPMTVVQYAFEAEEAAVSSVRAGRAFGALFSLTLHLQRIVPALPEFNAFRVVSPSEVPLPVSPPRSTVSYCSTIWSRGSGESVHHGGQTPRSHTGSSALSFVTNASEVTTCYTSPKGPEPRPDVPKFGDAEPYTEPANIWAAKERYYEKLAEEGTYTEAKRLLAPVKQLKLPYVCNQSALQRLQALFPRVRFTFGDAYTSHDHPVSHAVTVLGTRAILRQFPPGAVILDLWGNPASAAAFNAMQDKEKRRNPKKVEVVVQNQSPADYVRAVTKWGKHPRFECDPLTLPPYDYYMAINTLYYKSYEQVFAILRRKEGSRMVALVHDHPGTEGKLYQELSYTSDGDTLTQTSPSGESYTHPHSARWTSVFEWSSEEGGLAWTKHLICDNAWQLTIVATPPMVVVSKDEGVLPLVLPTRKAVTLGPVRVRYGSSVFELHISNRAFFDRLRSWMAGRERTHKTLRDLFVTARQYTVSDFVDGTSRFDVEPDHFLDHVIAAFNADVSREADLINGLEIDGGAFKAHLSAMRGGVFSADNFDSWVSAGRFGLKTAVRLYRAADPLSVVEKVL